MNEIQNCTQLIAELTDSQKHALLLKVLRSELMKNIGCYVEDGSRCQWAFERMVRKYTQTPSQLPAQWH